MPFKDNSFDVSICIDVINHIVDPGPTIRELKRVTCREGLIYFNLFNLEDAGHIRSESEPTLKPIYGMTMGREFTYHPIRKDGSTGHFYCRFMELDEARRFLEPLQLEIVQITTRERVDPPHEGFRSGSHTHKHIYVIARNK